MVLEVYRGGQDKVEALGRRSYRKVRGLAVMLYGIGFVGCGESCSREASDFTPYQLSPRLG